MGEERAEKGVWAEYRVMPTAGRAISFLFHVKGTYLRYQYEEFSLVESTLSGL